MNRIKYFFTTYPIFVLLLPFFFVLHGFTEYYNIIPIKDSLLLAGAYCIAAIVLTGISWFFFRNTHKASLFAFLILAFNFFFGAIHDFIKNDFPGSLFGRYSVLITSTAIIFLIIFIVLKRTNSGFQKFTQYLNYLFILLITIDLFTLAYTITTYNEKNISQASPLNSCPDCAKPDIYLILTDGYTGKKTLKEIFDFDNSAFEDELASRGFHITEESNGNYNFTPFAMASMLNLEYLTGLEGSNTSKKDMRTCFGTITKNKTLKYLEKEGYDFYNYSIFDFDGQPSFAKPTFLQAKTKPITSQTFLFRIQRDLWYHLVTDLNLKTAKNSMIYRDFRNNKKIYSRTLNIATRKTENPKFVYSHLVYPHYPYYFDSTGKETEYEILEKIEFATDKKAYISYMKYCNKELLKLIDHITSSSTKPPIICLVSDHGFREFAEPVDKKNNFPNLNAVLLPDKNYSGFYKGMSNINLFRVLLNTEFRQNLAMLKDSVSFLRE